MPLDLTEPFLGSLESLMLAQAQEGVWLHAVNGEFPRDISISSTIINSISSEGHKNGVVAKLAAKVVQIAAYTGAIIDGLTIGIVTLQ